MKREFLGWHGALAKRVAAWLLERDLRDACSLAHCWVIVPTANAGRVLKETLLASMAERGSAGLLSPGILTPQQALAALSDSYAAKLGRQIASALDSEFAWYATLSDMSAQECSALLPRLSISSELNPESLGLIVRKLISARNTLAEAGLDVASVAQSSACPSTDRQRWCCFARLEQAYRKQLQDAGLSDRNDLMVEAASTGRLTPGIEHLVLAATPDPIRLLLKLADAFEQNGGSVTVLVDAPETEGESFDQWGLPVATIWSERTLSTFEFKNMVHVVHGADEQATAIANLAEASGDRSDGILIGAASTDIIPHIEHALSLRGITSFNPGGSKLSQCRAHTALSLVLQAAQSRDFQDFCALLRLPIVHDWLARQQRLASPTEMLIHLDHVATEGLPSTIDDAVDFCDRHRMTYGPLGGLLNYLASELRLPDTRVADALNWLRNLARQIFASIELEPTVERQFLEELGKALAECEASPALNTMPPAFVVRRILASCSNRTPRNRRPEHAIDILGWLELPWAPADRLVIAGCSDGALPQSIDVDPLLPEPMRRKLGLSTNESRLARDSYLLRTLIEHGRENGHYIDFLCGLHDSEGAPVPPSRLFLLTTGDDLPQRVEQLFKDPGPMRKLAPQSIAWLLDPTATNHGRSLIPDHLGVTGFAAYLRCPFRFYLSHVLRIEETKTIRMDMDARQFGTLCHAAIEAWAKDASMRNSTDGEKVADYLGKAIEQIAAQTYGTKPPIAIQIQIELAKSRVRVAGHILAREIAQGWQVHESEWAFTKADEFQIAGMPITGRIDLILHHKTKDLWRVLDFKTTDAFKKPEHVHLGAGTGAKRAHLGSYAFFSVAKGRQKSWRGLQLPLYIMAMEALYKSASGKRVEAGYFTLTHATEDIGIVLWEGIHNFMDAAKVCAEGVVNDIRAGRFWPPADIPATFDEFSGILFPGGDCGIRHNALELQNPSPG